ncbi:MAG: LruC domain-containing protein [Bacteroidales bacterium]|nr:LruC domain-containing protein [Bacteroidales bacterium]MCF8454906.1 LruC domain-containing protein [Bacteroidales bacterium]
MIQKYVLTILLVCLLTLLFISSCTLEDVPTDPINEENSITNLEISDAFDWRTSQQVEFNLIFPGNMTNLMVEIESLEDGIVWAKGLSLKNVFYRKVILPTRIENVTVKVAGNLFPPTHLSIVGNFVEFQYESNLASTIAVGQLPWHYFFTNTNHTILVPATTTFTGVVVSPGDYIGVFYDSLGTLACGGYIQPSYSTVDNMFISAFGADVGNDGFLNNEEFTWKIWQASTGNEYIATATYNTAIFSNQGNFVVNGMSGITHLTVSSPDADNDGVADSNDDFPNDSLRAFDNIYPADGFGSFAFEDFWPGAGDYDFNDLVIDFQCHTIENANNVVHEIIFKILPVANGAVFHNGLGIQFQDVLPAWISSVSGYDIQENYINHTNGLENNQSKATIIVFDDAYNVLSYPNDGYIGVNTNPNGIHVDADTITLHISFDTSFGKTSNDIFASGSPNVFLIADQTRGREVHLPNFQPTDLADLSYFGTYDDDSDGVKTYLSNSNLPWGIETGVGFDHNIEKNSIELAYLKFIPWVQSVGNNFPDWYMDLPNYRRSIYIYSE